ncbi:MAG: undecaprenyl-phosphate glucose phosphotransferase [Proteobacteria bacterium]|nr:undecaprenyl-phosphate glucose phosphotransferase [Pseudomonadota bacterium]
MLKKQSKVILTLFFFLDLFLVGCCWNLAYFVRFRWLNVTYSFLGIEIPFVAIPPDFSQYLRATAVVTVLAAVCFIYAKMYNPKRISRYKAELRSILKANVVLYIILTAATFYYRGFSYSRVQSAYFLLLSIVVIFLYRFSIRSFLSHLRKKGKNLRRILIIGNGKTARSFVRKVNENRELGFVVVGHIYLEKPKKEFAAPYLGGFEEIPAVMESQQIDQVFIALDSNQQSNLEEINHYLAEQMADLNIIPDIYHTLNINPEILDLDGMPVIALRQSSVEGWARIFKRAFDLAGATFFVLLLLPAWIILPILIKLTSSGPVFYLQERMGLDGKPFQMIKFRSMKVGAEAETGAVWAKKDDERKTALGTFMRKTDLDEIPQFFNVLNGSMSLVGPRPERPVFIEEFKSQIPNYMLRHKMKAGITGWAQANGFRGDTSLEKRIEYDIYYLTHWSVWFDLKIVITTIYALITNPNPY